MGNLHGMTDYDAIRDLMPNVVPFVKTLGLEYLELDASRAVLRLRDEPTFHNHVGGPHAGAMFTLAESASGAVVIGSFEDLLPTVTPLAASATISYVRLAKGAVTAEAVLGRPAQDVRAELAETGDTVQFPVQVTIRTEDGRTNAEMTISWALRPNR
ncbi:MAG: hypothetical protein JWO12_3274 [Frankiales bacterium]|jgi:uncharacterized protein (TIGR00369 family)|nr:hypothetical protein [Frankiales bacterium]